MNHLRALRVFRSVIELGSFYQASVHLGLSASAVSMNIRELEDHLRTQLIQRSTRRLGLTKAGEDYFAVVSRILDDLDAADALMQSSDKILRGTLRITASTLIAETYLNASLPYFLKQNETVAIDLRVEDKITDLTGDGYDLALRGAMKLTDSTLIAKKMTNIRFIAVASVDYIAQHGMPEVPSDLVGREVIQYRINGKPDEWLFTSGNEETTVRVDGRYAAGVSTASRAAVSSGLGIGILPEQWAEPDILAGRMKRLLSGWELETVGVFAVYPARRHKSPAFTALLKYLKEVMRDPHKGRRGGPN